MKTLIVAVNSKYIHSSLTPWYLKEACGRQADKVIVREFTINEVLETVLMQIYKENIDIVAFSCYIWNISFVLRLAENLKKIKPEALIILGGPEVSFDPLDILESNTFVDFIISGEGEISFSSLIDCIDAGNMDKLSEINGIAYRKYSGETVFNASIVDVDECNIPTPYTDEMLRGLKGKIAYFESSRGCPYSCSYCLSSMSCCVKFFDMERVKRELIKLLNAGVRQIKFVDRTFNCNAKRARDIILFILKEYEARQENESEKRAQILNFHFEVAADLFDEETLQLLMNAPKGLFQLEIGIQSMNEKTLEAVNRKTDIDKVSKNIVRLMKAGNIHIHLDLIAGLPYEGMDSFISSFDKVCSLKPHALQLGFLKLLKGSRIRKEAYLHGYVYRSYAPYEVLFNNYISYDDLIELKAIEGLLDRYYNSGRFRHTLEYIFDICNLKPYAFFNAFSKYNSDKNLSILNKSSRELYYILIEFAYSIADINTELLNEFLKLDFLSTDNSCHLPKGINRVVTDGFLDRCFKFLMDNSNISKFLPDFSGQPAKKIFKSVHFETFSIDVLNKSASRLGFSQSIDISNKSVDENVPITILFNYSVNNPVTGSFELHKIVL